MKRFVFLFAAILYSPFLCAQKNIDYTRTDSTQIVTWLNLFRTQKDIKGVPQLWFAKQFLNRPYVASTLERNSTERLVVNLREVDCTTFVNQALALTLAARIPNSGFKEFCSFLTRLRYRNGKIDGYASRLHYYSEAIADHIKNNLFKELGQNSSGVFPFTGKQILHLNYMSTHSKSYKQLNGNALLISKIAQYEKELEGRTIRYIPVANLKKEQQLKPYIKDGDIIAIVTNKKGLDTSHLGFAIWIKGHLHLLNASSIHKKVVIEPMTLYQYMCKHPSQLGVRVIRLL